jgi:MSHA biogenesis protein MshM
MYLSHFGLDEPPFRITPHTDFFFAGASRGATLEALLYAITHDEGIVKVSGEVGSGKTMLCRVLIERLPDSVETIYLANPSLSREEILYAIADELKLGLSAERATRLLRELQDHLIKLFGAGRRVVVLIDEAHAMPKETLEEIRLLSNLESGRHKLLQIVLFGQPEIDEQLGSADMRQLKERITHSFRLEPMVRSDIESYIDFRMRAAGYRGPNVFSATAIRRISAASEGLTRRINILADKSLLAAFAHNTHAVGDKEARAAIRDCDFFKPKVRGQKYWLAGAGLAAGLAAGFLASGALNWLGSPTLPAPVVVAPATVLPGTPQPDTLTIRPVDASPATDTAPAPPQTGQTPAVSAALTKQVLTAAVVPAEQGAHPQITVYAEEPAGADAGPAAPARGKLVQQYYRNTQEWLTQAPGNNHSIQLLTVTSGELRRMEDFLLKASRLVTPEELHVYSVKIDGQQHYRAAYGQFSGPTEAQAAIKELPPLFRAQNPYPRSIERMRSQNRQ